MDEARQLMSTHHPSHGLEEMRHLLMCATLELDSARAVASAEVELHDAQVRHLQELLAAAQRERDEAREQYLGLQGCLSRSPSTNAGRGTAGSTTLGRRSRDHQSQQQQQQLPNSGLSGVMSPAASTVHQEVQQQQQQRSGAPASVQQLLPCKHVLPEPPEADLQVMLSSLPEKGKLMQAVMDAGPLLQTLLMASSSPQLPQWRHPPPGLESLQLPITNSSCATDPNMRPKESMIMPQMCHVKG
ncbi:unnamed protein product, partial [Sphagnum troendelagicum]